MEIDVQLDANFDITMRVSLEELRSILSVIPDSEGPTAEFRYKGLPFTHPYRQLLRVLVDSAYPKGLK